MLLTDHQQGSQDPLLSGLECMHTCVWFTPDRLFLNPLGLQLLPSETPVFLSCPTAPAYSYPPGDLWSDCLDSLSLFHCTHADLYPSLTQNPCVLSQQGLSCSLRSDLFLTAKAEQLNHPILPFFSSCKWSHFFLQGLSESAFF